MICPACEKDNLDIAVLKHDIPYAECECSTIYTDADISPVILTHNDNAKERNTNKANGLRLRRVMDALGKIPHKILDFGCGTGAMVSYLEEFGIQIVWGIDQDTPVQLADLPNKYLNAIFMTEVIEHLYDPITCVNELIQKLMPGGVLYIESSFREDVSGLDSPYVDPTIGHVSILPRSLIVEHALRANLEVQQMPHVVILKRPEAF